MRAFIYWNINVGGITTPPTGSGDALGPKMEGKFSDEFEIDMEMNVEVVIEGRSEH